MVSAARVQFLQILNDCIARGHAASDEIDGGLRRLLGELFQRTLPDTSSGAHKDSDGIGKCGFDLRIGGPNSSNLDHLEQLLRAWCTWNMRMGQMLVCSATQDDPRQTATGS